MLWVQQMLIIESVVCLLFLLFLFCWILLIWVAVMESNREWVTGLVTLFLLAVILVMGSKVKAGGATFRVLAVSLLILELLARNASLLPVVDRSFYEKPPGLLTEVADTKNHYRVYGGRLLDGGELPTANQFPNRKNLMASHFAMKDLLRPNLGMIYGLDYADGLSGLEMKSGMAVDGTFYKVTTRKTHTHITTE